MSPTGQPPTPTEIQQIESQAAAWAKTCALPAIVKIVTQILPQVVLALVNDKWDTLLAQIIDTLRGQGVADGLTAVTCAVANVAANAAKTPGMASEGDLPVIYTHVGSWLTAHPAPAQ